MPKFKPTLAATIESESQLKFPLVASPKLDGIRALGTATGLVSRTLKPIPSVSIQASFKAALAANSSKAHLFEALDGELTLAHHPTATPTATSFIEAYPHLPKATKDYLLTNSSPGRMPFSGHPNFLEKPAEYNCNQSAIMARQANLEQAYSNYPGYPVTKTGTLTYPDHSAIQICYWVFDSYRTPTATYQSRYGDLEQALGQLHIKHNYGSIHIIRIPFLLISDQETLTYYEEHCLALGFEGIIVRKPDSPYKFGRSTVRQLYLGKLKRFVDDEARIVDFEEQFENTNKATIDAKGETERSHHAAGMKPKNTLGALICSHPTFGLIRVGTGKGLTHTLRKEIWENQHHYQGQLIKFKYFPIGMQDKPRLPIFLGFRSPSDID